MHNHILRRTLALFSRHEKYRLLQIVVFQILLSLLDLLGVIALGLIGLTVTEGDNKESTVFSTYFLIKIGLGDVSIERRILILCFYATTLLIVRALLSIFVTKRVLYFLGRKSAEISEEMLKRFLSQSILEVQGESSQSIL